MFLYQEMINNQIVIELAMKEVYKIDLFSFYKFPLKSKRLFDDND